MCIASFNLLIIGTDFHSCRSVGDIANEYGTSDPEIFLPLDIHRSCWIMEHTDQQSDDRLFAC